MTIPIDGDNCRRAFQAIYGSWAGTLICQGRDDDAIAALLNSSAPGLEGQGDATAVAARARANILSHLPQLRKACEP